MRGRLGIIGCLAIAACTPFPPPVETPQPAAVRRPEIVTDPVTGRQQADISVLIYNVWGLPWPLEANSADSMRKIGALLGEMRMAGAEPDIVMLQEAFTSKSLPILERSGYPNIVGGPRRADNIGTLSRDEAPELIDGRSIWKGEKLGKWLNSGLAILSNFPIEDAYARPFRRRACAGFDCMANKGIQVAVIRIPGVPEPVEFFNTHMNSRGASGASPERARMAHRIQSDEMHDILFGEVTDDRRALIAGGDFNTRRDRARLEYLAAGDISPIVRVYCTRAAGLCDIRMSFDGDEPWLDTQDLQAFFPGRRIDVRPIAIEAMFDAPVDGRMLSDHDGYLVAYRLSWDPEDF